MTQIACQLYTLRDFLKTPSDIARTLARVRKIGYEAVQLSALGPIDAGELARILRDEGLICCATHIALERLREEPQKIIDEHKLWNCQYTAIGYFKGRSSEEWRQFARDYNAHA
ncbi:MAG: sugar phosphate isomerase/epimerase, partial [Phycisphaerae bacterium]|nr:sugar phosphate isomerase/epimerase [Phycisphaerae bacterium]